MDFGGKVREGEREGPRRRGRWCNVEVLKTKNTEAEETGRPFAWHRLAFLQKELKILSLRTLADLQKEKRTHWPGRYQPV